MRPSKRRSSLRDLEGRLIPSFALGLDLSNSLRYKNNLNKLFLNGGECFAGNKHYL